jgi:ADP-ribose pyrophosphatase
VVLVKSARGFVFVEVTRKANKGVFVEATRGYGEPGETARQCAARELKEETGFEICEDLFVELGTVQPNSAILASTVTAFFVDVGQETPCSPKDNEVQGLVVIPENKIKAAIRSGRIIDGFSLSAFAMFWAR